MDTEFLHRLELMLARAKAERQLIVDRAKREQRDELTSEETREFKSLSQRVENLEERVSDERAEVERSGRGPGGYLETAALGNGCSDAETIGRAFATNAAHALHKLGGEQRAVISGSVEVPILIDQPVVNIPFPKRLIDVFGSRRSVESMVVEYFRQTARTNNAAPVADNATKPTSVFTVTAETANLYYIATLTEPAPIESGGTSARLWMSSIGTASTAFSISWNTKRFRVPAPV